MASGIIQVTLLLEAMGLALLPFFQFFRGTPHQLAAIKQLEESMPPAYWRSTKLIVSGVEGEWI